MKISRITKLIVVLMVMSMLLSAFTSCEYLASLGGISKNQGTQDVHIPSDKGYIRCDADGNENENGMYILFGEYPQTIKSDNVVVTFITDDRGYHLGSDGYYYAAVTATPCLDSVYTFSSGETITSGETYYFKVEPIRWRILYEEGESAFILCDSIIANGAYQPDYTNDLDGHFLTTANGAPEGTYANNYMYSDVRRWLNDNFYKNAFSELQRELILTTAVDNSFASTYYLPSDSIAVKYVCENTNDKIFLLSFAEITNSKYGFSTISGLAEDRKMKTTDYSRASGALINFDLNPPHADYVSGYWWLRSPTQHGGGEVHMINDRGSAGESLPIAGNAFDSFGGIVPAMWINLET